jgi:hypothetical protein
VLWAIRLSGLIREVAREGEGEVGSKLRRSEDIFSDIGSRSESLKGSREY